MRGELEEFNTLFEGLVAANPVASPLDLLMKPSCLVYHRLADRWLQSKEYNQRLKGANLLAQLEQLVGEHWPGDLASFAENDRGFRRTAQLVWLSKLALVPNSLLLTAAEKVVCLVFGNEYDPAQVSLQEIVLDFIEYLLSNALGLLESEAGLDKALLVDCIVSTIRALFYSCLTSVLALDDILKQNKFKRLVALQSRVYNLRQSDLRLGVRDLSEFVKAFILQHPVNHEAHLLAPDCLVRALEQLCAAKQQGSQDSARLFEAYLQEVVDRSVFSDYWMGCLLLVLECLLYFKAQSFLPGDSAVRFLAARITHCITYYMKPEFVEALVMCLARHKQAVHGLIPVDHLVFCLYLVEQDVIRPAEKNRVLELLVEILSTLLSTGRADAKSCSIIEKVTIKDERLRGLVASYDPVASPSNKTHNVTADLADYLQYSQSFQRGFLLASELAAALPALEVAPGLLSFVRYLEFLLREARPRLHEDLLQRLFAKIYTAYFGRAMAQTCAGDASAGLYEQLADPMTPYIESLACDRVQTEEETRLLDSLQVAARDQIYLQENLACLDLAPRDAKAVVEFVQGQGANISPDLDASSLPDPCGCAHLLREINARVVSLHLKTNRPSLAKLCVFEQAFDV